jgi:predicted nucleic acid-binding protein
MKVILDASVALKWALNEEGASLARRLRQEYLSGRHDLLVPDLFAVEIAHALTRCERKRVISRGQALELTTGILLILPEMYPSLDLIPRAVAIASQRGIGVQDCVYAALAEQEHVPLLTADRRLYKVLSADFPIILLEQLLDETDFR